MASKPPCDGREIRALKIPLELRSAGQGAVVVSGYAARFNSPADIGWMIETIMPGAFARSLSRNDSDVLALNGHHAVRVVGRQSSGTLILREDAKGLWFENTLPDTSDGRDLSVLIERGDIRGMSIGFIARRDEWDQTSEPQRRMIHEAELLEITFTAAPAYADTSVALRSLQSAQAERRQHNKYAALGRIAARRMRLAQAERGILKA